MHRHFISTNLYIRFSAAIALGLSAALLLGGCALQRQSQGSQPVGPATEAIVQPVQPTAAVGAPDNVPVTPEVSAPDGSTPADSATSPDSPAAIEATSEDDVIADQLDQELQQLDDLNNSTDPLDDNP